MKFWKWQWVAFFIALALMIPSGVTGITAKVDKIELSTSKESEISAEEPKKEPIVLGLEIRGAEDVKETKTSLKKKVDSADIPVELSISNMTKLYWGFNNVFASGGGGQGAQPTVGSYNDAPVIGDESNYGSFDRHPCRRVCQQGKSMTCYYRLIVHTYQTLGPECQRCIYEPNTCEAEKCIYGDGVPNEVMAVNRQWPAPSMEVCEGDTIVADVINYLTEDTTMHWHGVHMSQTPDMDGAPYITQYPISPGEVQRYTFPVDRSGSNWYHSHYGMQRARGVAGPLVIRQTKENNRHANLYDYDLIEHTLVIQDIAYNADMTRPRNIVINGKGRNHLNSWADNDSRHRYERLNVSPGMRYRMRVISNGVFNCPLEFSIENHRMLMISTDGNDLQPVYADKFFMTSAERFDFILQANQYPGNYWIRVKGYNDCEKLNLYQGAVLHYRGSSRSRFPDRQISDDLNEVKALPDSSTIGVNVLPEMITADRKRDRADVPTLGLSSLTPLPWPAYTKFLTYYSSFGILRLDSDAYLQVDDITFAYPTVSLLQGRHLFNDDNYFCNRTAFYLAGINCLRTNCECTNVIRVPAYKPIEMVVTNYMNTTHPFHSHGYTFRLVGQDIVGNVNDLRNIQELDRRGLLKRLPDNFPAVEKDTIQVPPLGYIIIRFISDNPGFWTMHCHVEGHALEGMTAVLKVGENHQIKKIAPKLMC
ncbi:multicopper oxidase 3 [Musca autumnalis]|uniref:multicopper oxidase 3 n=1 Tax=Musca autumnalis TaxID=221902 RepID=UPI003CEF8A0A